MWFCGPKVMKPCRLVDFSLDNRSIKKEIIMKFVKLDVLSCGKEHQMNYLRVNYKDLQWRSFWPEDCTVGTRA